MGAIGQHMGGSRGGRGDVRSITIAYVNENKVKDVCKQELSVRQHAQLLAF